MANLIDHEKLNAEKKELLDKVKSLDRSINVMKDKKTRCIDRIKEINKLTENQYEVDFEE